MRIGKIYIGRAIIPARYINARYDLHSGDSLYTYMSSLHWVDITDRVRKYPEIEVVLEDRFRLNHPVAGRVSLELENYDKAMTPYITPLYGNHTGTLDPYNVLRDTLSSEDIAFLRRLFDEGWVEEYILIKITNEDGKTIYLGALDFELSETISPRRTVRLECFDFGVKYLQKRRGIIGFLPWEYQDMSSVVPQNRYGAGVYYSGWVRGMQTYETPVDICGESGWYLLFVLAVPIEQDIDSHWTNRCLKDEQIYMYLPGFGYEQVWWIGDAPLTPVNLDTYGYDTTGRRIDRVSELSGRRYKFYEVWFPPRRGATTYFDRFGDYFGDLQRLNKTYPFPYDDSRGEPWLPQRDYRKAWESSPEKFAFIFRMPTIEEIYRHIYDLIRPHSDDPAPPIVRTPLLDIEQYGGTLGYKSTDDYIFVNWSEPKPIAEMLTELSKYTDALHYITYDYHHIDLMRLWVVHRRWGYNTWRLSGDVVHEVMDGKYIWGQTAKIEYPDLGKDAELKDAEKLNYEDFVLARYRANRVRYKLKIPWWGEYKDIKIGDKVVLERGILGDVAYNIGVIRRLTASPENAGNYPMLQIETEYFRGT